MVFHLGVLNAMAEYQLLEQVDRISTVSGGSLLTGLILHENGMRWPNSYEFIQSIYPALREKLCEGSLQWSAARQLLNPMNWRYLLSRANLLALALQDQWGVSSRLSDLPICPEWSINGTTAENGKRFRFKRDSFGDYHLGYAEPGDFPLATALAVSAAFPAGFGPLSLSTSGYIWKKRPRWDAPKSDEREVEMAYKRLHLYDGGVYDNLGLEPFFDAGKSDAKPGVGYIVVSDAGAPLAPGFSNGPLNPFRLVRVADIMSDQSRALRIRTFATYVQEHQDNGAYIGITTPLSDAGGCPSRDFASSFPTSLKRIQHDQFDKIAAHGAGVTRKVRREFGLAAAR